MQVIGQQIHVIPTARHITSINKLDVPDRCVELTFIDYIEQSMTGVVVGGGVMIQYSDTETILADISYSAQLEGLPSGRPASNCIDMGAALRTAYEIYRHMNPDFWKCEPGLFNAAHIQLTGVDLARERGTEVPDEHITDGHNLYREESVTWTRDDQDFSATHTILISQEPIPGSNGKAYSGISIITDKVGIISPIYHRFTAAATETGYDVFGFRSLIEVVHNLLRIRSPENTHVLGYLKRLHQTIVTQLNGVGGDVFTKADYNGPLDDLPEAPVKQTESLQPVEKKLTLKDLCIHDGEYNLSRFISDMREKSYVDVTRTDKVTFDYPLMSLKEIGLIYTYLSNDNGVSIAVFSLESGEVLGYQSSVAKQEGAFRPVEFEQALCIAWAGARFGNDDIALIKAGLYNSAHQAITGQDIHEVL